MPRYQQSIPLYRDTETSLLVAYHAFTNLGWKMEYAGDTALCASPSAIFKSKDCMVSCRAENGALTVESEMVNNQSFDLLQKNKKNTTTFIEAFAAAQSTSETVLTGYRDALDTLRQHTRELAEKEMKAAAEIHEAFNFGNGNLYLTYGIIVINILVFIAMAFSGAGLFEANGWVHIQWGSSYTPLTLSGDWWRLITSTFIHFGIIHLLMNMYCLYTIGIYLEPMLGKAKFATAYLCTGLLAGIVSLWWHTQDINGAGASGAVFGMYGVFLSLLTTKLVPEVVRKSLLQSIVIFIGYNLLYGMKSGVDNAAHAGGLISGCIIGYLYAVLIKREKEGKQLKWAVAVVALLTVMVTLFYLQQHQVPLTERQKALETVKELGYADNDRFNAVLQQFDEYAAKEYTMLTDTTLGDKELAIQIDREAMPAWQMLEQKLVATAGYKISPAAHEKASLLVQYIGMRKRELGIIKQMTADGQAPGLVQELNKTRDSSNALYEKIVPAK